jgi:16S rRNA (guanine527-N7)-methyltransferase
VSLEADLAGGLEQLGMECPLETQGKLIAYIDLLGKWNRVYNLTAIHDRNQMLTHHILDSLAVTPYLHGDDIVDVGSGAGLPGVPLALVSPQRQFVLLDSNAKKTRFIQQAKAVLELDNVTVATTRAEAYRPSRQFDTVLSRAFAAVSKMVSLVGHLCKPDGVILAMKGEYPGAELLNVPPGFEVEGVYPLQVPGLEAQRHLVRVIRREVWRSVTKRDEA